ncbi:BLUF domain-containing protein [Roseomonas sp. CECT 9278]|uniref:BLUF domain-containing protein n=1 Tax=Roseomonas sp. CECT 9278 TaxID=2845823 RepID=UPI001E52F638|nr:BLUF domain-containing protein [Roseomonas sp. CECT 9278]CAH0287836.1 hypothetical protein ROS9278_04138 [Roseomonas sp. CECT 9278]
MASAIYRLIYRSVFAIPSEEAEAERELRAILDASRRNNAASGLTGALLHNGPHVVQVLEGPLAAIEAVFDRIAADVRHTAVELLQFAAVAQPSFPAWSMAYIPQGSVEELALLEPMRNPGGPEAIDAALATLSGALRRDD